MRDIEDEVKCSECPNARHGFDRDASHNEGRYVCQCESHKCPAESLRQQLAEANAEIERLNFKLRNLALDCIAADGQAFDSWQQLAASQAREQQLREAYVLLENFAQSVGGSSSFWEDMNDKLEPASVIANFEKADTSALEAMITKAGEVMRERCIDKSCGWMGVYDAIRALPVVTLDDLKD